MRQKMGNCCPKNPGIEMIEFVYRAKRLSEKMLLWLVYKLPKRLVYWCAIRVMAHATTGQYSNQIVSELTAMDALKRWESA
jgi:hypothetical protein